MYQAFSHFSGQFKGHVCSQENGAGDGLGTRLPVCVHVVCVCVCACGVCVCVCVHVVCVCVCACGVCARVCTCVHQEHDSKQENLQHVLKTEHVISTEALSCTYSNWLAGKRRT